MLDRYDGALNRALLRPLATVLGIFGLVVVGCAAYPLVGRSYFPRTDPGQFVINLKAPTGTRVELTNGMVGEVEKIVREEVPASDLRIVVANIGITPDFSAIYTSNSGPHTAFVQVGLAPGHRLSSFAYMDRVSRRLRRELPQVTAYFQTGGLVDAVLNLGLPAPIDLQIDAADLDVGHRVAAELAGKIRALPEVSDVLVPQDVDYPALKMSIDRVHAAELGLNEREIVDNMIAALTSNGMIAPNYWIDPKSGNSYLLTVQYYENKVKNFGDLGAVPLRGEHAGQPTTLDAVTQIRHIPSPTEVDHYQLRRVTDVYVSPRGEDLAGVMAKVERIIAATPHPANVRVQVRGSVQAMSASFRSFGLGLILSTILVYLILVAQFRDPSSIPSSSCSPSRPGWPGWS